MESYSSAPGVFDIFPDSEKEVWKDSSHWQYVELFAAKRPKILAFAKLEPPFLRRQACLRAVWGPQATLSKKRCTPSQIKESAL